MNILKENSDLIQLGSYLKEFVTNLASSYKLPLADFLIIHLVLQKLSKRHREGHVELGQRLVTGLHKPHLVVGTMTALQDMGFQSNYR